MTEVWIPLLLIALGIILQFRKAVEAFVKFKNAPMGLALDIRPETIWYWRIAGIVAVIAGLYMFLTGASIFSLV